MPSDLIPIMHNISTTDFSGWTTKSICIFTTAQLISSIKTKSEGCKIFLFDKSNDKNNSDQQRFKTSDSIETQLIWLTSNTKNYEEDVKCIQEDFEDYFSSNVTFGDFKSFDLFLANENKITDLFIIIYNNYEESTIGLVRQLSNVKYIYRYGESKNKDNNLISNRNDLRYCLASDLMDHYAKLGEQYRTNKQSKLTRKTFEKA
ncbi:unnamed protein product [Rotaria magnacalcarata]|uniref:Uncharacterized protein n=1 Tax=Rotaria magnacalcarata TaxID=392030 RepID=A0A816E8L7_9BILA|nr:unnamed protein product [Rotaria magnacalcarata]CAF1644364.1 unnamed protein product [Rotaria magnacalcarata]CAF4005941.1 unnamed protein product [Rotaria magnacalcarata]